MFESEAGLEAPKYLSPSIPLPTAVSRAIARRVGVGAALLGQDASRDRSAHQPVTTRRVALQARPAVPANHREVRSRVFLPPDLRRHRAVTAASIALVTTRRLSDDGFLHAVVDDPFDFGSVPQPTPSDVMPGRPAARPPPRWSRCRSTICRSRRSAHPRRRRSCAARRIPVAGGPRRLVEAI